MIKNATALIALTALLCGWGMGQTYAAEKAKLVAANYSDRYHLSTCKIAQNIRTDDRLVFETPGQAIEGGFNPCRKCNPPTEDPKKS